MASKTLAHNLWGFIAKYETKVPPQVPSLLAVSAPGSNTICHSLAVQVYFEQLEADNQRITELEKALAIEATRASRLETELNQSKKDHAAAAKEVVEVSVTNPACNRAVSSDADCR